MKPEIKSNDMPPRNMSATQVEVWLAVRLHMCSISAELHLSFYCPCPVHPSCKPSSFVRQAPRPNSWSFLPVLGKLSLHPYHLMSRIRTPGSNLMLVLRAWGIATTGSIPHSRNSRFEPSTPPFRGRHAPLPSFTDKSTRVLLVSRS